MEESKRRKNLENLARQDELTGLGNHHALSMALERTHCFAERHDTRYALLSVRIEFEGQPLAQRSTDLILSTISREVSKACRRSDEVFRSGPASFAALLNETDEVGAEIAAARIVSLVREAGQKEDSALSHAHFAISFGIGTYDAGNSLSDVRRAAARETKPSYQTPSATHPPNAHGATK